MRPGFAVDDGILKQQLLVIKAVVDSWVAVIDGGTKIPKEDIETGAWRENFIAEMRLVAGTAGTMADIESTR